MIKLLIFCLALDCALMVYQTEVEPRVRPYVAPYFEEQPTFAKCEAAGGVPTRDETIEPWGWRCVK